MKKILCKIFRNENNEILSVLIISTILAMGCCTSIGFFKNVNEKKYISLSSDREETNYYENLSYKVALFFDNINTTWDNNIIKKSAVCKVDSIFTYFFTGQINSSQVLYGKNNWLFFKSKIIGDCMADYMGTNSYTELEMKIISHKIKKIQTFYEEQNIRFALVIGPNKQSIYFENMPDIYEHAENSRTDLLFQYMSNNQICAINPKHSMLQWKDEYQLFYKYDTHWNHLGGYLAVRDVLEQWKLPMPSIDEVRIVESELRDNYHYGAEDDLAAIVGLRSIVFKDELEYTIANEYKIDWEKLENEQSQNIVSYFYNDKATNDATLLLMGDSYRVAMLPALCTQFSNVYVTNQCLEEPDKLYEINPEYVIIECVERGSERLLDYKEMISK